MSDEVWSEDWDGEAVRKSIKPKGMVKTALTPIKKGGLGGVISKVGQPSEQPLPEESTTKDNPLLKTGTGEVIDPEGNRYDERTGEVTIPAPNND